MSKFALPALLFKNMVLLDFGDVIWAFLWSVLVAKVGVSAYVYVCVCTFYFISRWFEKIPDKESLILLNSLCKSLRSHVRWYC